MEVLDTKTFLVYHGLKRFRLFFWAAVTTHFTITLVPATLAGLQGEWYLIWWRVYWGNWIASIVVFTICVSVYGSRTLKMLKPDQARIFKMAFFNMLGVGVLYLVLNGIQIVLLDSTSRNIPGPNSVILHRTH